MSQGSLKGYLKKVIGLKEGHEVYKLSPYRRVRKNQNGVSRKGASDFLEDEIQDLVAAVLARIDSLPRKFCSKKQEHDWRTGCPSCGEAAEYRSCKLDFRIGKNNWHRMKKNKMAICYPDCYEDLRNDDCGHTWQVRMHFPLTSSCIGDFGDSSVTFRFTIKVPRAYHLIRVLQLLSLPRCRMESVPEQIVRTLSTALAGPFLHHDNRNNLVSNVKVIECHNLSNLTLPTMQLLRDVLMQSETLEQLHLEFCYIPPATEDQLPYLQLLADGLASAKSTHLKVLRLSNCNITDDNAAFLVTKLHSLSGEPSYDVQNLQNGQPSRRSRIETLFLQGNYCDQATLRALVPWLDQPDCPLRSLDLSVNSVSLDLSPLSRALRDQKQRQDGGGLRHLNLSLNEMPDEGVRILADALKDTPSSSTLNTNTFPTSGLQSLGLAGDRSSGLPHVISFRGMMYLGESLALCRSLQHLDLSYYCFDPESLNAFCMGLVANESINSLRIRRPSFVRFPQVSQFSTGSDWVSIWGGTLLPQQDIIPSSSPKSPIEYLCQVLITSMAQLTMLDISYADGIPVFFYENLFRIRGLEILILLGSSGSVDGVHGQALVQGVSKSTTIVEVYGVNESNCWSLVKYYLRLNTGWRKYSIRPISSSLWPLILERSNQRADGIYHLLRDGAVSVI